MSDAPLYPSQDGPGAGTVVEVTVRVMVGPVDGRRSSSAAAGSP